MQHSQETQGTEAPTCYRHPDRETHIRCTRCERAICPDCMIDASVGFQCPECVREGNRGVRTARTLAGGRVSGDPGWVTRGLLALIVGFYVLQLAVGAPLEKHLVLIGYWPGAEPFGVAAGDLWRLLTVVLLHGGVLHLLLNAYALWVWGPTVEAHLGRLRFGLLYALSALGGSAASYAFNGVMTPAVGASGALFGLAGALVVLSRRLRYDASGLYLVLAVNFVAGFLIPRVDWRAHIGGFLAGLAVTAVLAYAPRQRRLLVQAVGVLAVAVVIASVVGARTAQIRERAESCPADATVAAERCLNGRL